MTKIINLIGSCGVGKSTGAAYLFAKLKMLNIKCELLHEYAKTITYQKRQHQLKNQGYIFEKQRHYLEAIIGQVDYIITDSPIILSLAYLPDNYPKSFSNYLLETWNKYINLNFLLKRVKPYQNYGRNQSLDEALALDNKIFNILQDNNIPFTIVEGSEDGYYKILDLILKEHKSE